MVHRYFTTCLEQEGSSPRERCNWAERKSLIFFLSWPFHYFLATHLVTHTRKLGCPPFLFLSYSTSNSCILQIRVCKLVGQFGLKMCFVWPYAALSLKKKIGVIIFKMGYFAWKSKCLVSLHQKTKTETWAVFPHVAAPELQLPPLEIFFSGFSHLRPRLSPCLLHCFMLPAVDVWTCNSYFIQPLKSQISSCGSPKALSSLVNYSHDFLTYSSKSSVSNVSPTFRVKILNISFHSMAFKRHLD